MTTDLNTEYTLPSAILEETEIPAPFLFSSTTILAAFANCLNAVQNIARTEEADTGKYKYRYADLGHVLDEVKRVCQEFGLSFCQIPGYDGDRMTVTTVLLDQNGGWLWFPPAGLPHPREAQAYGSALTYLRRYTTVTLFAIALEDDDGAAATSAAQTQPGRRTEAERMIRQAMGQMDPDAQHAYIADFKRQFKISLTDMPANRHGDALTWTREWVRQRAAADEDDAKWQAEAGVP